MLFLRVCYPELEIVMNLKKPKIEIKKFKPIRWIMGPILLLSYSMTFAQSLPMSDSEEDETDDIIYTNLRSILESREELANLINENAFAEAYPIAFGLTEMLMMEFGEESEEYANGMQDLAIIQRNLGLYEDSIQSLYVVIEYNYNTEGSFSEKNIFPLQTMGANYYDLEDYQAAFTTFEDARLISRRTLGLLNEVQLEIMRYQSNLLIQRGDIESGIALQNEALRLARRASSDDYDKRIDFLYQYADWFFGVNQWERGRGLLIQVLDMQRAYEGEESPNIIRTYRELGTSYRRQQFNDQNGLGYLLRANRIISRNPDTIDAVEKALLYRDLGDWYTAFSRVTDGGNQYLRAWEVLRNEDGSYPEILTEWFAEPVPVIQRRPNQRGLTNAEDERGLPGIVIADYFIDETGRTREIEIIESSPEGLKDGTVYASIRDTRYRPIMIDAIPMSSDKRTETFSYLYIPTLSEMN